MSTVISTTAAVKAGISSKDVGGLLAEQRRKLGLCQADIAKLMGFTNVNFISMLESASSKIPINKIDLLIKAYQLPAAFVLVALQAEYPEHLNALLRIAKKTPLIFLDVLSDPTARIERIFQITMDSIHTC